ncbi:MAG: signal peptidase I [Planctomycetes bacterium]|nr:signal peptidase I [Planctomycetota bacterium]
MHQDQPRRGRRDAPPIPEPSGISETILSFFRSRVVREIAESVVIAFALAFLFRTFEAEAFVIPTGSMAPTLVGRHRDVNCPECKFHFRVSASLEVDQSTEQEVGAVFAATCPQCGLTACINPQVGQAVAAQVRKENPPFSVFNSGPGQSCQDTSWRNGNRILVSKFAYEFREPRRWDVFVFRPPRDASKNYIKRLVGLPGETLRIYRGDLYKGDYDPAALFNPSTVKYEIERKPADKVLSMKQLVYDNDYVQDDMTRKGWPTRWSAWPRRQDAPSTAGAWQSNDGTRSFVSDGSAPDPTWVRYQHFMPSFADWEELLNGNALDPAYRQKIRPQLITDTYAYNSSVGLVYRRQTGERDLDFSDSTFLGLNWVRDLVLECELTVEKPQGAALLELVAGGVPLRCQIDLATGMATLSINAKGPQYVFIDKTKATHPTIAAQTPMRTAGTYRLRLANVDHQLHLWVNEKLVELPIPACYGQLRNFIPKSDAEGGLDLAPAGVGSQGAALRVSHMRLYRDVYYIAKSDQHGPGAMDFQEENVPELMRAFPRRSDGIGPDFQKERAKLFSTPSLWPAAFANLNEVAFPLAKTADPREDQFLALGDNSPQSLDSRLWPWSPSMKRDRIGGPGQPGREYYVERDLLIGKALLIYWPVTQWRFVR